jgi:hypothetical protein
MYQKSIPLRVLVILLLTVIACGSSPPITPTRPATSTLVQIDAKITATATTEDNDNNGAQAATPTDTPTSIPPTPTPAPTDTPASMPPDPPITLEAPSYAIRLTFDIGAISVTHTGVLEDNTDYFLINVRAGQIMTITTEADGEIGLSVATPSGIPLKHSAVGKPSFSYQVPENGDYHVIVVPLYDGTGPINYTMTITIPPLETSN